MTNKSQLRHNISNEIVKVKSLFEILLDEDDNSYPKEDLLREAQGCLDNLWDYLRSIENNR